MCYYNGQKVSRAEFIRLLNMEKAVKNYDFLNRAVHNGFAYGPVAVLGLPSTLFKKPGCG